jgi:hypothetical protein
MMTDATYVAYVPKHARDRLVDVLRSEDTGELRWREDRKRTGSEFYFTGPSELARKTHAHVIGWLIARRLERKTQR